MDKAATTQAILERIADMPVIDAHEHLAPESDVIGVPRDVFSLFQHYTARDFARAGCSAADWGFITDQEKPLDKRWD